MQGSWNRKHHEPREPGAFYDPDRETAWWHRCCCLWSLFEMFTCCSSFGLLAILAVSAILLACGARL